MAEPEPGGADAASAAGERDGRAFITTVDAETKVRGKEPGKRRFKALEASPAGPRIAEHHRELTDLAFGLEARMAALLSEHERDFFLAYKTHMYSVQREIKALRMKAEHEEAKTREDTKIKALESELDWFVQEAVRLDELCKSYRTDLEKWRTKAKALDEDRKFLEDQIKGAKRQNKILRAAAERAKSSAQSALMATRTPALEDAPAATGGYPPAALALRPHSVGGEARPAAGSAREVVLEARSRTPDARQTLRSASSRSLTLEDGPSPAGSPVGKSVLGNEAEERYVEAMQHLKECIAKEQGTVRMLRAAKAASYSQKSEMEEFFLKCVEEARRDQLRRRYAAADAPQRALEVLLGSEEVLVALYERLFPHRAGMGKNGSA